MSSLSESSSAPGPRYGAGALATGSAVLLYFLATSREIAVIERVRPGGALIDQTAPAMSRNDWQDDRTVGAFALDDRTAAPREVVS